MSGYLFPVLVLVTWVTIGLSAVIFLGRHGRRSGAWYVIGVVLGPILLPIALDLARREGMLLTRSAPETDELPSFSVLVAVDGSGESDNALDDVSQVLAPTGARYILLTVMDPDLGEHDAEARRRAEELLRTRADGLPEGCLVPILEVASGEPARVVLERAAAEGVDLVVIGRRGQGLSERILGSVADQVVRRSPRPVLLGSARR